jgi:nitrogen-specific signal transduction histidine kinase
MPRIHEQIAKAQAAASCAAAENDRLRAFAEAGADWFWEMDATLRFTYVSDRVDGPMHAAAALFLGKRIGEVLLPGLENVDWRPAVQRLALRAPFRDFRFVRRGRSGLLYHVSTSGVPVFDDAGEFCGYRGIGRDLAKEAAAERRATIAQTRLTDAIESVPDGFMLLDARDRLILCNSSYRELHAPIAHCLVPGTSFEEICRASARAGLPAAAIDDPEEWVRDRLERHRRSPFEIEERQVGDRWFQIAEQHTSDGGTVVVQTEITAVKRRERELAETTALLRATLDKMEQGLLVLDPGLNVKTWNDRLVELLEPPPRLLVVGAPLEKMLRFFFEASSRRGHAEAALAERLEKIRRADTEPVEARLPTGKMIDIRRARMADGGVLITVADISDRRRVEADLRRARDEAELASRSKTEFLANMSHELRTPLNAIIGFADILMGQIFGALGDARYVDYARDIRDSGLHLLNLINDVLDVSKVEFGKVELTEEIVDVVATIHSCVRLMRDRADSAGLKLVAEVPPRLPAIQGDSRRLKQILLNLLSNAVKFTPSGGRVTIAASDRPDGFRMSVADTGIGIAAADLDKALRPFGQIDSRLARKYQGTGLGLPLARSMAELHGGRLELFSAPGQGTTATIWLPPSRVRRVRV